jgi:oligopeptide transport system substrate-binding protein
MEANQYFDRLATDPPAFWSLSWIADYPSPNDFLGILLGSGSTSNYSRWSSPEFDAAIRGAVSATDPALATSGYERAEAVVQRDVPVIPMSYTSGFALVRDGLLGAGQNGLGILRMGGLAWSGS